MKNAPRSSQFAAVMNNRTLNKFTRTTVAMAITTVLPLSTSFAQEIKQLPTAQAEVISEDSYKVDKSSSVKYTQPLLNTAKTVTVISQSLMKDRNVDSLRDALRSVSGISMAAGEGGTPTGDSMSIRGFSAQNNIMIDGVRDISNYTRDTYNIEAVEVAKGPGSAVYGRGSAGGSINLTTKTAKLDEFNDVSLRIGSEGDYRAKLDSNTLLGDTTALRVNLLTDDGDVAGRDEVNNAKNAIALSLATGLGTDSRFNINAEYQDQDNMPDYGLPWVPNYTGRTDRVVADELIEYQGGPAPTSYSNFYGNVDRDFEEITAQSVTAKYEYDVNESTTLRVLGRLGTVERLSIVSAPRFYYEENDEGVRVYGEDFQIDMGGEKTRDTKNSLAVIQADLLGSYTIADVNHDIVAGVEFAQEKFERWNYTDVVDDNLEDQTVSLFDPDPNLAFTGEYARTGKSDEATADTVAIYLFDTITLSPQWIVSAGLRYDMFDTEYYYQLDDEDEPNDKLETSEDFLSWNLGIVYKPSENSSIYFGAGNSYTSTAEDVTVSSSGNAEGADAEETTSYEFGAKWELFDGKLSANAAIFRSEKLNALTDAEDGVFEDDDDRYNTSDGEIRVDGVELSLAGQINSQLLVTAAYTFQDSEVLHATGEDAVQEGYELARTPEHSLSLWARYEVNDDLAFGLGAEYVGERYNSSDPGGREKGDDYMIFDMMASYDISNQWSVQLNASNLTDEDYEDQLGGGHFIPGAGRYASLTTSFSF